MQPWRPSPKVSLEKMKRVSKAHGGTLHPFLIQLHTQHMASSTLAAWASLARLSGGSYKDQSTNLMAQAAQRAQDFYQGVARFHEALKTLETPKRALLWESPFARLYAQKNRLATPMATCVWMPSLLNTSHIFDLDARHSLAGFLKTRGVESLFVDWRAPLGKSPILLDYANAAAKVLRFAQENTRSPLFVGGFCMGGLLALAGAGQLKSPLAGAALFATPWDFQRCTLPLSTRFFEKPFPQAKDLAPSWALQLPFHLLEPRAIQRKYQELGKGSGPVDPLFARLEAWLCDLRPLQWDLLKECVDTFYTRNTLFNTNQVLGTPLRKDFFQNTFMVAPTLDRIVPSACTLSLASFLGATPLTPAMGHVGTFASKRAPSLIWEPLAAWFQKSAS